GTFGASTMDGEVTKITEKFVGSNATLTNTKNSVKKTNGELAFASGLEAEKLTYSGYRALSTTCAYDPASDSFIALWREATQGQGQYRVVAQRISKEGELLWGDEGLIIENFSDYVSYDGLLLRTAQDGEMAIFYMRSNGLDYGNVDVCMQIVNTHTGELRWDNSQVITDLQAPTQKNEIQVSNMLPNGSWIFGWDDRGTESIPDYKRLYLNRANYDGTVGNKTDAAEKSIEVSRNNSFILVSHVDKNAIFAVEVAADTQATIALYNTAGACVAVPFEGRLQAGAQRIECEVDVPAGIYLASFTTSQDVKVKKLIIK
ncbi:MAG: T9SS type A sorting domain-containing protein, partial [Bacteroidales bacterium]|nr:T9SS type A sorting domain-containing protein [Bacteroidales bacterium]